MMRSAALGAGPKHVAFPRASCRTRTAVVAKPAEHSSVVHVPVARPAFQQLVELHAPASGPQRTTNIINTAAPRDGSALEQQQSQTRDTWQLPWDLQRATPLQSIQSLFLPDGYPSSVTPDYLPYQLWAAPTHILGSLAHALTTSSLLQAVGVTAGPVATTAASAAIKWITKDGIGALGRFLVGGQLAPEFDRDPRKWRMVGELCTSLGAALEIATAAFPQHFLLLAGSGHFAKALGKSIGKPVFRVIQTHFARANNVGAVAAKEEVWEVVAQLGGYAASLAVLTALDEVMTASGLQGQGAGLEIVGVWALVQSSHIALRYKTLSQLVFPTLNEARARALVAVHLDGLPLPGPPAVNASEPFFFPSALLSSPRVVWSNVGLAEAVAGLVAGAGGAGGLGPATQRLEAQQANGEEGWEQGSSSHLGKLVGSSEALSISPQPPGGSLGVGDLAAQAPDWAGSSRQLHLSRTAEQLVAAHEGEEHLVVWRDGQAFVLLFEGAAPQAVLRALWQAAWLQRNAGTANHSSSNGISSSNGNVAGGGAASVNDTQPVTRDPIGGGSGDAPLPLSLLRASVEALQANFPAFVQEAQGAGWDIDCVLVATGPVRLRVLR
ncbi:hypothetical protein QJQ45_017575 [Haematococcus lacustris]|nr:hypothetical protein QJQ45_017575 [Haematococcus lacustris]